MSKRETLARRAATDILTAADLLLTFWSEPEESDPPRIWAGFHISKLQEAKQWGGVCTVFMGRIRSGLMIDVHVCVCVNLICVWCFSCSPTEREAVIDGDIRWALKTEVSMETQGLDPGLIRLQNSFAFVLPVCVLTASKLNTTQINVTCLFFFFF